MGCVIKYKGQSIPEEQFLQYLNKQIAANEIPSNDPELEDISKQQINELFESNPKLANKDRLGVESTEESSKTEAVVTNTTATPNIDLTASYFGEESTDKT